MKDYLDEAKRIINHNSSAMIAGNKFYRRNRIIDMAITIYVNDSKNFKKLYEWVTPDIVNSEYRSIHYGVPIGTQIGWNKSAVTSKYFDEVAKIKWILRREFKESCE